MFEKTSYLFIILSTSSGLLSLLGSVGIFVSLIVQRRVERLQDILEELIDQSYHEDQNLSNKIYRLIQKYQMHYLLPDRPTKNVTYFIDITIALVLLTWLGLHILIFSFPVQWQILLFSIPFLGSIVVLYFFRKLLKNAINPLDNPLLNGIIPPPTRLRSISFLSRYVNVSVKSLLKQARLALFINQRKKASDNDKGSAEILLKEELSFDEFFYYISIISEKEPLFIGFGKVIFSFSPDSITGKPVPIKHNINVPLGYCSWEALQDKDLTAKMLLFPHGEKYPIQYTFRLDKMNGYFTSTDKPEITVNTSIVYKIKSEKVSIVENKSDIPMLDVVKEFFDSSQRRYYLAGIEKNGIKQSVKTCTGEAFVS